MERRFISVRISLGAIALSTAISSGCVDTSKAIERGYLVSTVEIVENTDSFIGQSVAVRNDIVETIGKDGFILDQDSVLNGETILVIDPSQTLITVPNTETPEVIVSGTVEKLNLSQFAQKHNLNLDSNLYSQYEGKPAIVATSVILSPDPHDLTKQPELYYDRPLAIQGEVDEIGDFGVFELDEEAAFGGEDLIVVSQQPIELKEEQNVIIYGVLRPFVAEELKRDYDLDWDLETQQQLEAKYEQKPVFVAEKIRL